MIDGVLLVATLAPFALAMPMAVQQIRLDEAKAQKEVVRITGIEWSSHKQAKRAEILEERRTRAARASGNGSRSRITHLLTRNSLLSRSTQNKLARNSDQVSGSLDSLISGNAAGSPAGGRTASSGGDECASLCVDTRPSRMGGPSSDAADMEPGGATATAQEAGRGSEPSCGDDVCAGGDGIRVATQPGGASQEVTSAAEAAAEAAVATPSRDAKGTAADPLSVPSRNTLQRQNSVLDEIRESVVGFFTPFVQGGGSHAAAAATSTTKQEREGSVRV